MNDNLKTELRYWFLWLMVLSIFVSTAYFRGDMLQTFRDATPRIIVVASLLRIGFVVLEQAVHLLVKAVCIASLVLSASILNTLLYPGPFSQVEFAQETLNAILFMGAGLIAKWTKLRFKRQEDAINEDRRAAEQRALNARLAPHVMYNMLNAIYAASLKEPARASSLVLSLSSMMRHLTNSADRSFVDAQDELDFIRSYTELVEAQGFEEYQIELDFPDSIDARIPSLLCATLFENAVTHSQSADAPRRICASFSGDEDQFVFAIGNTCSVDVSTNTKRLGSGITSIRRRLKYVYPGRHQFTSTYEVANWFSAEIRVWQ